MNCPFALPFAKMTSQSFKDSAVVLLIFKKNINKTTAESFKDDLAIFQGFGGCLIDILLVKRCTRTNKDCDLWNLGYNSPFQCLQIRCQSNISNPQLIAICGYFI